ncbi:glycosyltransferase [Flavobacterium sp. KACC 22761]|uniref:glycosyltransferase n=1 Tax=Flavobacterium sp. KACC 22761 TaxID=3092665 RepID=UPI002A75DD7D|nr:glycosyltransferase [Flavobacterium sp. KACC 22761]WPO77441.1 glycosyltransferase [Flavobacterium sp. KACC 22761]
MAKKSEIVLAEKISIISLCYNDETYIKKHFDNLSFANEIILIDNNSTDKSVEIAKELGATVISQNDKFKADCIKLAIETAKNNWVVLLNCTDHLSEELINEMSSEISKPKTEASYFSGQTLFFFGKTIKYGVFLTRKKLLLFDKTRYSFSEVAYNSFFKRPKRFKNKIESFAYKNFDDFSNRVNIVRKEEALVLFKKNKRPTIYHFFIKPFFIFINQFFLKLGFLNGREGFILAYIYAFSILKRYFILWLLYRNMD